MIALMQEALLKRNPAEVLADRVTRWFVPAVFLVAIGTGFYLWMGPCAFSESLLRGLTVLVISCPCALGIATPIVKVAAMGVGRRKGILVRDPAALEQVKNLNTLVFDKTGTLTGGSFDLQEIYTEGGEEKDIRAALGAVDVLLSFSRKSNCAEGPGGGGKNQPSLPFRGIRRAGSEGIRDGENGCDWQSTVPEGGRVDHFFLVGRESGSIGRIGQNRGFFRMGRTRSRLCRFRRSPPSGGPGNDSGSSFQRN